MPAADFAAPPRHWPGALAGFFEGQIDGSPPPGFPPPAGKGEAGKARAKGSGRGRSCLVFFCGFGALGLFLLIFPAEGFEILVFPEMFAGFGASKGGLALEEKAAATPFFSD